jgi:KilA-N domain
MVDVLQNSLVIRGRKIAVDEHNRVRLNDIHSAGGFSTNQLPTDWVALVGTTKFIATVAEKRSGKSGHLSKSDVLSVYCVKKGRGGGIWVDPIIALAYAKYLSPTLHYEVNEVFLRHKAGDAALADETLKRASPEANEWAGVRALGRAKRNELTQTLSAHQVKLPVEYAQVTNETYKALLGKTAKELKEEKGLKQTANLRDAMPTSELVYLMASEQLAKERIEDEDSQGVGECSVAASKSAGFIRRAIQADRANRIKKKR